RVRARWFRPIERAAIAIRRHHPVRFEQQSSVGLVKQINVAKTDGAHGVIVIRPGQRKKLRLLAASGATSKFVRELEGDFHRGRTVVGEKDFGEGERGKRRKGDGSTHFPMLPFPPSPFL